MQRSRGSVPILVSLMFAACSAQEPPPDSSDGTFDDVPSSSFAPSRSRFSGSTSSTGGPAFSSAEGGSRGSVSFGSTEEQPVPPPPIAGGTLLAMTSSDTAVVSDPANDLLHVVNLETDEVRVVPLVLHDEPARLVEGAGGHVHVVLRGPAELLTLDVATLSTSRESICTEPRGIAFDAAAGKVVLACRAGELWTFTPGSAGDRRVVALPDDLRDVVIDGPHTLVSRFRSAEVLVVQDGALVQTTRPFEVPSNRFSMVSPERQTMQPSVAWRMVPGPGGGALLLHQRSFAGTIDTMAPDAYGNQFGGDACDHGGLVESTVTVIASGTAAPTGSVTLGSLTLAVDLAFAEGGQTMVVAPGNARLPEPITVTSFPAAQGVDSGSDTCARGGLLGVPGTPVAAASSTGHGMLTQTQDPAGIYLADWRRFIPLPDAQPRRDTGHVIFHANAGAGLACASCHPDGDDDGRTWNFIGIGARRTPALRFGLSGTEPFHWNGEFGRLTDLMREVFERRMAGPPLDGPQSDALLHWLDGLSRRPSRPAPDAAQVSRGQALFEGAAACSTCHAGPRLTNNTTVDVGTGGSFQVPSLVGLGWRAPFMHDGCATTIEDRFTSSCGGDRHGTTGSLTAAQKADLAAYLMTL